MTAFTASNGLVNNFDGYTGGSVNATLDTPISMCIYTITHRASGRVYVGQTSMSAKRRWQFHCTPSNKNKRGIAGAIRKYGKEAFDFQVIDIAENSTQLDHKECFWITRLNSLAPSGFNLESGGNKNKSATTETRRAQREARAAWLATNPDTSKLGNGSRGRKRRPEEVAAIKVGLTGRSVSAETKERIAAKQRGVPKTRDYTLRMARARMKGMVLKRSDGAIFLSYLEAEESMRINRSAIHAAANGRTKSCGGFAWSVLLGGDV